MFGLLIICLVSLVEMGIGLILAAVCATDSILNGIVWPKNGVKPLFKKFLSIRVCPIFVTGCP